MAKPYFPESDCEDPVNQSAGPNDEKCEIPEPNNKKDLIIDHVKTQDTKCIFIFLASSGSKSEKWTIF